MERMGRKIPKTLSLCRKLNRPRSNFLTSTGGFDMHTKDYVEPPNASKSSINYDNCEASSCSEEFNFIGGFDNETSDYCKARRYAVSGQSGKSVGRRSNTTRRAYHGACDGGCDHRACDRSGRRPNYRYSGSNEWQSSTSSKGSARENYGTAGQAGDGKIPHKSYVHHAVLRGCSGDCHGCCHGDCGRYGHFSYHDDFGRCGEARSYTKVSNSKVADYHTRSRKDRDEFGCLKEAVGNVADDASYLAAKLRSQSSQLAEALNFQVFNARQITLSAELHDKALSLNVAVGRVASKLEYLEDAKAELFAARKLLQLEKAKNKSLVENIVLLEMQIRDLRNSPGQFLHEPKTQSTIQAAVPLEKGSQTGHLVRLDEPTADSSSTTGVAIQTEGAAQLEVETQTGDILVEADGSDHTNVDTKSHQEAIANKIAPENTKCLTGKEKENDADAQNVEPTISDAEGLRTSPEPSDEQPLLNEQPREFSEVKNGDDVQVHSIAWPCDHYKRLCLVSFSCCDKFYPCHRCHNKNGECSSSTLKSIDAKLLKCLACSEVQEFTDKSQNCIKCGIEFAKYFCRFCRHLTGVDETPYHCFKCGICRVKGDRSFHCDNCGVCLDIQLRDNHVCRSDSAHDPCCICLEDAFSGCQILPCGHKIHKDCAITFIRTGARSCPICRQSSAHRLQRVPKS